MEKLESISTQKLSGFDGLLKRTWQIYKARFWTFLGILFILFLIELSIFSIVPFIDTKFLKFSVLSFISVFLIILLLIFIYSWVEVSLLYAIKERELKIGIKESFKKGWPKIISYLWISLLAFFITLGGVLLFILPGIIFNIWFLLAQYSLVSEDLKGMNALLRSKQLIRGNWWEVFWRFLGVNLISTVIVLIFTFGADLISPVLGSIISSILNNLLLRPFLFTFIFLIYEDLKRQKEAIPFESPKRKTKLVFILIGIIGTLLIPAIAILLQLF